MLYTEKNACECTLTLVFPTADPPTAEHRHGASGRGTSGAAPAADCAAAPGPLGLSHGVHT